MSIKNSRTGASQAIFNSQAAGFFALEAGLFGIGYGFYKGSWISGLIAFCLFAAMIYIPYINYIFAAFMTFAWGYVTWIIANSFGNEEMTLVLTFIAAALSGGIHFYSIQYYSDLNKTD